MVMAKLLTPGRTPAQDNCGEMFCPKQSGFAWLLVKATRTGTKPPSSKVVDESTKDGPYSSAPLANPPMQHEATTAIPASANVLLRGITSPPDFTFLLAALIGSVRRREDAVRGRTRAARRTQERRLRTKHLGQSVLRAELFAARAAADS